MIQALQLLTILAAAVGLALYAMFQDEKEHAGDPRQPSLFPNPKVEDHDHILTNV